MGVEGKKEFDHKGVSISQIRDDEFKARSLEYCEHDVYITKTFVDRFN